MAVSWRGVYPAVCTQFHSDHSLNIPGTLAHVDAMLAAGIHGIIMMGSVGENTTLGDRFGYYKNLMLRQIGSKWNTGGMANDGRKVLLTFSILRDGSIESVKVAQPSGNYALDTSAQRALMEASPLPQLPDGYTQSSAQVELWFQVK